MGGGDERKGKIYVESKKNQVQNVLTAKFLLTRHFHLFATFFPFQTISLIIFQGKGSKKLIIFMEYSICRNN